MKKSLLIILIAAIFASCTKNTGQCYTCTFGTVNGYKPPDETYCGPIPYHKTVNGVETNVFCTPK